MLEARCRHVTNSPETRFERRCDNRFGRRGVGSGHGRGLDRSVRRWRNDRHDRRRWVRLHGGRAEEARSHGERSAHPDRDQRRGQEQEAPSAWTPRTRDIRLGWRRLPPEGKAAPTGRRRSRRRTRCGLAVRVRSCSSGGPPGVGGLDLVVELLQGVVESRLDGAGRNAEAGRDLVDRQVPVEPQCDDHLVIG